ncbi:MAG: 30S ribosomal protein S20 [Bdellovibrionales bacterium]|nr:30S ribosomal protein S20 [Bdellovibrionales bacterium]
MANTKSAKKRARQTPKRTARNYRIRNTVKTAVRSAREALTSNSKEMPVVLKTAVSQLSKAATKGTIHKRNAARRISRLMKAAAKAASAAPVVAAATTAKKKPTKSAAKKA